MILHTAMFPRHSTLVVIWDINGWVGPSPTCLRQPFRRKTHSSRYSTIAPVGGEVTVDVTSDAGGIVPDVSIGTYPGKFGRYFLGH